ncbi:MAG: type II toxin-antitoxin system RelE/ParE family toxin [Micropepsaceae bacterium]
MVRIPKAERRPKKLSAAFYETAAGAQPVREWLLGMSDDDRKIIGDDIATAEFGWPVGMPVCRPMGGGLFELRSHLAGNRIARVLFCTTKGQLVLLHGFEKKTRKTPASELALAKKRMKEIEE